MKKHNRLLHWDEKTQTNGQIGESSTHAVFIDKACSGLFQVQAVRLSNGANNVDMLAVCRTGTMLSFIDQEIKTQLGTKGKLTLSVACSNGTKDMDNEKISLKVIANDSDKVASFHVHPRMYHVNSFYYSHIREKSRHLKVFPNNQVDFKRESCHSSG